MKANEAPEKIYVTECMLFATNPEITLQGNGNKIEYTRTDVFIEKAWEYFGPKIWTMLLGCQKDVDEFKEDFVNYMKGE